MLLPFEAMKFFANTIADVSHQYEHCDGKLGDRNRHVAEFFSVIRRGRKSEEIYGTRLAAIPSEVENLVCWNGFADAQALKVFSTSTARAASQRHTEHVLRKGTAILDACFHTDIIELIHARPPRGTEPEGIVVWLLSKAHSGARRAAQAWQEFFRNEVFVRAGGSAGAMEPNTHHKAEYWDDDDSGSFMAEWRMDIKSAITIETATKIVKQVSTWRSAGKKWSDGSRERHGQREMP